MKRLSLLTLLFSILSLVFIILLILLRFRFGPYPLVSYQDVFDVLTPLVLIPVYWLLFRSSSSQPASLAEDLAFMVLAALWAQGQGLHLSANAIDNLIEGLARSRVLDIMSTDVYRLTYFFDEGLGHYLWHLGTLGLAALLVYHEWRRPAGVTTTWWAAIVAGLIYGFCFFCIFLEGQTVVLGLPFAVALVGLTLLRGRARLSQQPVLAFFFVTCLVAVVLFAGWGAYWHGFPQFSDVGLI